MHNLIQLAAYSIRADAPQVSMFFLNKDYAVVSLKYITNKLNIPCGIPLFSTLGSIT